MESLCRDLRYTLADPVAVLREEWGRSHVMPTRP